MIFEILDSEEEKQDIIIADVIRSFLAENVEAIIFIFSGGKKVEKRIIEALVTIAKGLVYKGVSNKDIPFDKSGSLTIKRSKKLSESSVKERIIEEFFKRKT